MKVTIVGSGHVGRAPGAGLTQVRNHAGCLAVDASKVVACLRRPRDFGARKQLDAESMPQLIIEYDCVGRSSPRPSSPA